MLQLGGRLTIKQYVKREGNITIPIAIKWKVKYRFHEASILYILEKMYTGEVEVLNTDHHFTSQDHVLSDARVTHTPEVLMHCML